MRTEVDFSTSAHGAHVKTPTRAPPRISRYTARMKYLGIDYGERRVGLAVSNEEGTIAFPRGTLPNTSDLLARVRQLAEREKAEVLVVGDARSHSGKENPVTPQAEAFIEQLAAATGKPVAAAFEAWSSIEASRFAPKGREHDDSAAAAVILQRYLDMRGNGVP